MHSDGLIFCVLSKVLELQIHQDNIPEAEIQEGIRCMAEAYKPRINSLSTSEEEVLYADYNRASHRCAYLHKIAPFHVAMVRDIMARILNFQQDCFANLLKDSKLQLCCLGGGPGTDVLGVLMALHERFGLVNCSADVLDLMPGWKNSMELIVEELMWGNYGNIGWNFRPDYFRWRYLQANLLGHMVEKVEKSIQTADFITMVKFVSAAACWKTNDMLQNLFQTIKPGALLLFIDNAAGGFSELVSKAAKENQMRAIFGPLEHFPYSNELFRIRRFGFFSCNETRVSVQMFIKNPVVFLGSQTFLKDASSQRNRNKIDQTPKRQKTSHVSENKKCVTDGGDFKNVDIKREATCWNATSQNKLPSAFPTRNSITKQLAKVCKKQSTTLSNALPPVSNNVFWNSNVAPTDTFKTGLTAPSDKTNPQKIHSQPTSVCSNPRLQINSINPTATSITKSNTTISTANGIKTEPSAPDKLTNDKTKPPKTHSQPTSVSSSPRLQVKSIPHTATSITKSNTTISTANERSYSKPSVFARGFQDIYSSSKLNESVKTSSPYLGSPPLVSSILLPPQIAMPASQSNPVRKTPATDDLKTNASYATAARSSSKVLSGTGLVHQGERPVQQQFKSAASGGQTQQVARDYSTQPHSNYDETYRKVIGNTAKTEHGSMAINDENKKVIRQTQMLVESIRVPPTSASNHPQHVRGYSTYPVVSVREVRRNEDRAILTDKTDSPTCCGSCVIS